MDDLLHTRVGLTGTQGAPSRGPTAPVDGGGFLSAFAPEPSRAEARARDRATDGDTDSSDAMASGQPADPPWQGGPARATSTALKGLAGREDGAGPSTQDEGGPAGTDTVPWADAASARPPLQGAAVAEAGGSSIMPGPETGRPGPGIQPHLMAAEIAKLARLSPDAAESASDGATQDADAARLLAGTGLSDVASRLTGPGVSPPAAGSLELSAMLARATMHLASGKFAMAPVIDPAAPSTTVAWAPTALPLAMDLAPTALAEPLAVVTVPDALLDPALDRLPGSDAAGLGQASVASAAPLADRAALPQPAVPISQQIVQALANPGRDPDVPLDLALDPPELGRVRLSFAEVNGTLTLTISVERPETADLMRRHIALLNEEFARAGLDAPSVSISQGGADERSQSPAATPMTEAASRDDLPDEQILPIPDHLRSGPPGGLDLRL